MGFYLFALRPLPHKRTFHPTGFILASCRYWENFVTCDFVLPFGFKIECQKLQEQLDHSRFRFSFITALVKSMVLVGFTFLVFVVLEDGTYVSNYITTQPTSGQGSTMTTYQRIISLLSITGGSRRFVHRFKRLLFSSRGNNSLMEDG